MGLSRTGRLAQLIFPWVIQNKILKIMGDVYVSNAHLKTKFHGVPTNRFGIKNFKNIWSELEL